MRLRSPATFGNYDETVVFATKYAGHAAVGNYPHSRCNLPILLAEIAILPQDNSTPTPTLPPLPPLDILRITITTRHDRREGAIALSERVSAPPTRDPALPAVRRARAGIHEVVPQCDRSSCIWKSCPQKRHEAK
jgi:hypothetical protein